MSTSDSDPILLAINDGVALVTFNLPEKGNAWSKVIGDAYLNTLEQLSTDDRVRVVVVTGAGDSFCVGGDPTVLGAITAGEFTPNTDTSGDHAPYYYPMKMGKPVIAAINGACFGLGLQLALYCDIRFIADNCKLATGYARRGVIAELGMSWLLPRVVGRGRAMDLLLSSRVVRAEEALSMGLAERVVAADKLIEEALDYAKVLASKCGPQAMRNIKQQVNIDSHSDFQSAFSRSELLLADAYHSADFKEGVNSWRENRAPAFPPLPNELSEIQIDMD